MAASTARKRVVCVSAAVAGVCALLSHSALSATETWTGATNTWNTAGNWAGTNLPPISGDSLIFGAAGAGGLNLNDNLTSGAFNLAGITFNAGASAFVIGDGTANPNVGNTFALTGGITNNGSNLETINDPFSMTATQTFTTNTGGGNITLGGAISGVGGGLSKAGAGTLTLNAASTYGGGTTISAGTLQMGNNTALGSGGTVTLSGGTLAVNSGLTVSYAMSSTASTISSIVLLGNGGQNFGGSTLTGTGTVNFSTTANAQIVPTMPSTTGFNGTVGVDTSPAGNIFFPSFNGGAGAAWVVNGGGTGSGAASGSFLFTGGTAVSLGSPTASPPVPARPAGPVRR